MVVTIICDVNDVLFDGYARPYILISTCANNLLYPLSSYLHWLRFERERRLDYRLQTAPPDLCKPNIRNTGARFITTASALSNKVGIVHVHPFSLVRCEILLLRTAPKFWRRFVEPQATFENSASSM